MNTHAQLYRGLYRIRRVEEEIARVYATDVIKSPIHLSIGQEAVSVGVCSTLQPEDIVFGTYRGHALYLAKGGSMPRMIAELYGKTTGCAKGKGGSMHLIDASVGMMGTSAVVGTTIPQAVGYAYALKVQKKKAIVACFFGDGATEEGVFYESLNFAALKKLPLIFVCENNTYSIHTHQRFRQSNADILAYARAAGIPTERIEDNDVLAIHERVGQAVANLREGDCHPHFFECMTYRWREHVGPNEDYEAGYRSREEAEPWMEGDQIPRLAGMLAPEARERIEAEVETEVRSAFEFAEESAFPDAAELYADVYQNALEVN